MAYSIKEVETAIINSGGIIVAAAKNLGCNPSTVYRHIRKSKHLQKIVEETACEIVGHAECTLSSAMTRRDETGHADQVAVNAAKLILSSHPAARRAGYGEKKEFDVNLLDKTQDELTSVLPAVSGLDNDC